MVSATDAVYMVVYYIIYTIFATKFVWRYCCNIKFVNYCRYVIRTFPAGRFSLPLISYTVDLCMLK